MKPAACALICFLLLGLKGFSDDREAIQEHLRKTLENKLLTLRNPYAADHLQFDSQGKLLGSGEVLPWTTHGLLYVKKLRVANDAVDLEGQRAFLIFNAGGGGGVSPAESTETFSITIRVAKPLTTAQVNQALLNVFTADDLDKHLAEYWKPLIDMGGDLKAAVSTKFADGIIATKAGGDPVYCCLPAGQLTPPVVDHLEKPEYPEDGRSQRIEGTVLLGIVVEESGAAGIIRVNRALGKSFDMRAAEAVSRWRFRPATKNGKPIAVYVTVQLDFHLH